MSGVSCASFVGYGFCAAKDGSFSSGCNVLSEKLSCEQACDMVNCPAYGIGTNEDGEAICDIYLGKGNINTELDCKKLFGADNIPANSPEFDGAEYVAGTAINYVDTSEFNDPSFSCYTKSVPRNYDFVGKGFCATTAGEYSAGCNVLSEKVSCEWACEKVNCPAIGYGTEGGTSICDIYLDTIVNPSKQECQDIFGVDNVPNNSPEFDGSQGYAVGTPHTYVDISQFNNADFTCRTAAKAPAFSFVGEGYCEDSKTNYPGGCNVLRSQVDCEWACAKIENCPGYGVGIQDDEPMCDIYFDASSSPSTEECIEIFGSDNVPALSPEFAGSGWKSGSVFTSTDFCQNSASFTCYASANKGKPGKKP